MRTRDDQACYGYNSVKFVLEQQAAETVLISDNLFRAKNVKTRRQYVALAEMSRKQGAKMLVFGSETPAGARLKAMTGVAAILRFPLQGLDDVDEESDVDSEEERINAIRAGMDPDASQQDEESKGGESKSQESMSEIDSILFGLIGDEGFDDETQSESSAILGSVGR